MGVRDLVRVLGGADQQRSIATLPWWPQGQGGLLYGGYVYDRQTSWGQDERPVLMGERAALTGNAVVYSVLRVRLELFAQGRFCFRRLGSSFRPTQGDLFTTDALAPLDEPVSILESCELDVAATGASFWTLDDGELRNLPAEWCAIVLGSNRYRDDPALAWDAKPIGLVYDPPVRRTVDPEVFLWSEVASYIPERDPDARFRGMSWVRPAMEDIHGDNGARRYLTRFWENNATPNTAVTFPVDVDVETVQEYRDLFFEKHKGVDRAFRTTFMGGGADFKVLGSDLKTLDTESIRTQVHKDIAAAAGVPIVAAGIEQGTYANSKESNRALADRKVRYLWRCAQRAFSPLITVPSRSELWIDTSGISALQADALDDAQVLASQMSTIRQGLESGFDPDVAVDVVTTGDLSKLKGNHTGWFSVQLQPPTEAQADDATPPPGDAGQAVE